jgi:small subunit ribosomal protein S6
MYIGTPDAAEDDITQLNEAIEKMIANEGGTVVRTDNMGRRPLAYPIKKKKEGYYVLFEVEGNGQEIAELERRMRVNDAIIRFITVRVDEERKTADKHRSKREARHSRQKSNQRRGVETENAAEDVAQINQ